MVSVPSFEGVFCESDVCFRSVNRELKMEAFSGRRRQPSLPVKNRTLIKIAAQKDGALN